MFERWTAVEADTGDAGNFELDYQYIALLAGWVVTGCPMDGTHRAVGKGLGIKASSGLGISIVPEANRVLCHCISLRFEAHLNYCPLVSRQAAQSLVSIGERARFIPLGPRCVHFTLASGHWVLLVSASRKR